MYRTPLIFYLCLTLPWFGAAVQKKVRPPKSPVAPIVKKDISSTDQKFISRKIMIRLIDGSSYHGKVSVPARSIECIHSVSGQNFSKNIEVKDILSITFLKWKGVLDEKHSRQYNFYPAQCRVRMKNNEIYTVVSRLTVLDKMTLDSNQGRTVFFSYFVDYRKAKGWLNSKYRSMTDVAKHPHPRCVKELLFLE